MIEIKDLKAGYDKKTVLHHLHLRVPAGHIRGIVGLNGAGKSTLFNLIAKIKKPDSGEILLKGIPLMQKEVGYIETNNYFYSMITGREYLNIFQQTNPQFNLDSLQSFLHLPLDDLIETYSTGMKKKLALLAVLKQDKTVYLFDEPFNGLDIETNKVLELIILALKEKGKTVIVSSHIMEPLLVVCDEIAVLENGSFTRSFKKDSFNSIDSELFGSFKEKAKEVIRTAV
jgi:ABC-2 type transport system ATP-binding protein